MKAYLKIALLLILLFASIGETIASSCQTGEEDVRETLYAAYEGVAEAESRGGKVSSLVDKLNEALVLLNLGGPQNLADAESLISSVIEEAPLVEQRGLASTQSQQLITGVVVAMVLMSVVLVWRFGSRVFWSVWLLFRFHWKVTL